MSFSSWTDQRDDTPASAVPLSESSSSFARKSEVAKHIALLYGRTKLSDVTFVIEAPTTDEQVRFPAHRNIVSVWSAPLDAMLTGVFVEGGSKEVVIKDVCPFAFDSMLKFMYTGEVDMDIDNVLPLLDVAGRFDVNTIVDFCVVFLQQHTTAEYACQMLEVGVRYGLTLLINKCIELIVTEEHVLASDDFLGLSKDAIDSIVSHDAWNLHEDDIFDCILRWTNVNTPPESSAREEYMKPLIEKIRYPHLSVEKLRTLSSSGIVPSELIFDALFYKLHSDSETQEVNEKDVTRYQARLGSVLFGWCPTPKVTVSGQHFENVRHTSSNGFICVKGNRRMVRGCYRWTVDVIETQSSWIFIGICLPNDPNEVAWRSSGRMLYCLDSRAFHQGSGQNHPIGDRKVGNGDSITVVLDCDARTLAFGIDKDPPMVIFRDLPAGSAWIPAIDLRDCGDKVRLVTNNSREHVKSASPLQHRHSTGAISMRESIPLHLREVRHSQQPRQTRESSSLEC